MTYRDPKKPSVSWAIESVHGKLGGLRERFKWLIVLGVGGLLMLYIVSLLLWVPQDFWSHSTGTRRQASLATFLFILVPFVGVVYGLMAWGRSSRGRAARDALLRLDDGTLTVEIGGNPQRSLPVGGARVSVGTWICGGTVGGPLIRIAGPAAELSIAAHSPPLALAGIQGSADIAVDIDDFRELARILDLGPVE